MHPERLELPTFCSEDRRSIQLSYGCKQAVIIVYLKDLVGGTIDWNSRYISFQRWRAKCYTFRNRKVFHEVMPYPHATLLIEQHVC